MFSFRRRSKERTCFFRARRSRASTALCDFSMASRRERSTSTTFASWRGFARSLLSPEKESFNAGLFLFAEEVFV